MKNISSPYQLNNNDENIDRVIRAVRTAMELVSPDIRVGNNVARFSDVWWDLIILLDDHGEDNIYLSNRFPNTVGLDVIDIHIKYLPIDQQEFLKGIIEMSDLL